jgi:hypothetical protein
MAKRQKKVRKHVTLTGVEGEWVGLRIEEGDNVIDVFFDARTALTFAREVAGIATGYSIPICIEDVILNIPNLDQTS